MREWNDYHGLLIGYYGDTDRRVQSPMRDIRRVTLTARACHELLEGRCTQYVFLPHHVNLLIHYIMQVKPYYSVVVS